MCLEAGLSCQAVDGTEFCPAPLRPLVQEAVSRCVAPGPLRVDWHGEPSTKVIALAKGSVLVPGVRRVSVRVHCHV